MISRVLSAAKAQQQGTSLSLADAIRSAGGNESGLPQNIKALLAALTFVPAADSEEMMWRLLPSNAAFAVKEGAKADKEGKKAKKQKKNKKEANVGSAE